MENKEYAFAFIKEYKDEWAKLAKEFEKLLFEDLDAALVKARKLTELIVEDIFELEQMENLEFANFSKRLWMLKSSGVLEDDEFQLFDRIRRLGNLAAHANQEIPFADGLKVHKNLYLILKWFMESYGSYDFQVPEYQDPKPENVDEKIDDKVRQLLQEYLPKYLQDYQTEQEDDEEDIVEVTHEEESDLEDLPAIHGSRLLFQLNRLRESSQDAVEGYKGLSNFKQYLHVTRPIEKRFEEYLIQCAESHESQLILLCGSVGDGKSHLLSYFSTKYPELMSQFRIHNDATESFDPQKNSIDTLAEVLEAFSDEKIATSQDKLIVAINLGVLNNFIESPYANEQYTKLKEYILNSNVFDSNTITTTLAHPNFKILNFADYKPFELTKNGAESTYLAELFQKITAKDENNPFYQAYQLDKREQVAKPLLINYEMFSSLSVQQQIIQLIIKTIVKDKVIVSTRAILNFIYDILVPNQVDDLNTTDFADMLPSLLPNLLFDGHEKSYLLKMVANHDPIHLRIQEVDEKLIEFNNTLDPRSFFKETIEDPTAQTWMDELESIDDTTILAKDTKRTLSELFIRSSFLFSSNLRGYFQDDIYNKYMNYLYAYNTGQKPLLQPLYKEVHQAIFLWKGSPKNNYIFLDDDSSHIRIAEPISLKAAVTTVTNDKKEVIDRFVTSLNVGFTCDPYKEIHEVEIDLPLYEMIMKVLNGYRLNRKDREDSIKFIDFIGKLLPYGKQNDEILIIDLENHYTFNIQYDDQFESYTFYRE